MIDKILRLGKEAAIYGLSSIVGRFLNFLLVPIYTNLLLPADYGVIATLYSYIAFAAIVFGYGMDAAYMRFAVSWEEGDKKQTYSVPLLSVAASSFLLSALIHWHAPFLSNVMGLGEGAVPLVRMSAWILFFDAIVLVPYAALRMENKAGTFAIIRITNIVLTIVFNVIFLVGMDMKADGVVLANLVSSALTVIPHLRGILPNLTFRLSGRLYKQLLAFGLPYLPAGLASVAMQVIDRPIMKALTDDATVGIYQANYRMGVFMMLVVGMFDYAWRPFFLRHAREPGAKQLFSRVFTFFCVLAVSLFVVLTLFIEDLIRIRLGSAYFIHPDYWEGAKIIPVILLAYVLNGAYVNFLVGVYLEKRTSVLPYIFGAGAVVNVAANVLLIPLYGMMGAAYATLLSYAVLAAGIFVPSQRLYRIEYEWGKILALLSVATLIVSVFRLLLPDPAYGHLLVKAGLVAAFAILVLFARVVSREDFKMTRGAVGQFSDAAE